MIFFRKSGHSGQNLKFDEITVHQSRYHPFIVLLQGIQLLFKSNTFPIRHAKRSHDQLQLYSVLIGMLYETRRLCDTNMHISKENKQVVKYHLDPHILAHLINFTLFTAQ